MPLLPVSLNVHGANCLIVGGGAVAARKARDLLTCQAHVRVVSPSLSEALTALISQIEYSQRNFQSDDLADVELVFACTNDTEVNSEIARLAREHRIWCNSADDAAASTLHSMAVVRRGEIAIGISTSGGSPALAKHLKEKVESSVGGEYEQLLKLMSERRDALKESQARQPERARRWREVLASNVLELLRAGQPNEAAQELDFILDADLKS